MTPSLEGLPTKAKEPPSLHELRLDLLDTNSVFQCLGDKFEFNVSMSFTNLSLNSVSKGNNLNNLKLFWMNLKKI